MIKAMTQIPKPPKPPSIRYQCGTCGYTDSKDTYEHTCWIGIVSIASLVLSVAIPIGMLIAKFYLMTQ